MHLADTDKNVNQVLGQIIPNKEAQNITATLSLFLQKIKMSNQSKSKLF